MRIQPIEKPRGLGMRIAWWLSRRRLGVVMTPLKVIYARAPGFMRAGYAISTWTERGCRLEPELKLLVQTYVAGINGCGFCVDIARAMAVQQHVSLERFEALPVWETSPLFDPRQRAALAYAGEVTRTVHVGDETFEALRKQFDDEEVVQLTLLCAIESFYNRLNGPLEIESDGLCAIQQGRRGEAGAARAGA